MPFLSPDLSASCAWCQGAIAGPREIEALPLCHDCWASLAAAALRDGLRGIDVDEARIADLVHRLRIDGEPGTAASQTL